MSQGFIASLQNTYPDITFHASDSFYWSPRKKVVHFVDELVDNDSGRWSLLHELGHALLDHKTFNSDFELVKLELAAWQKAEQIAKKVSVKIPNDHIQDCLDTYREWLYLRSTCPHCTNAGQQIKTSTYSCFNCNSTWQVSRSRQCRSYRRKVAVK